MELFLYLIFLDLDKIDVYRDKTWTPVVRPPVRDRVHKVHFYR